MGTDDHVERLARIEGALTGMQAEMATMRDALMRLVRIEEQHAATRDEVRRVHARLDDLDNRMDAAERRIDGMRGPLVWLSGIAATVVAGLVSVLVGRVM
ncbi:hypothetical protein EDC62_0223 [Tibeticola sediminis]|uniref:Uncharacterized protein n=1 Tax=Tibeticola sediminis TaxID=1917811 RepID=A0A3N4UPJ7_9BURK|nr:hypothetical protein [Tibeticola sediminis]RPE72532.1 hypothetical protein EDC62_0223 [Tibeticola sediminis]